MTKTLLATFGIAFALTTCGCQSKNDNLLSAIKQKNVEAVRKALASGVDLEPLSGRHDVNKPLGYAAVYGNLEIVKLLVDAGADLNGQTAYGDVPLIKADEHDNDDIIEYLMEAGADVNAPNDFGMTPFIGLCGRGRMKFVELATNNNADLDSSFVAQLGSGAGTKNFSPLQAAVDAGQKEVVKLLMSLGVDATAKDFKGRSPIELAESKGHKEVAELLREHLASGTSR